MADRPVLYVGIAAPLVEAARVWQLDLTHAGDAEHLDALQKSFPSGPIHAYDLAWPNPGAGPVLQFRTGLHVSEDRVREEVRTWSGQTPTLLPTQIFEPVAPLDHRNALDQLTKALAGQPIRVVPRVGLTLQTLQEDLARLEPECVLLDCHGTAEGCLLLEDGRGRADFVPGDRLLDVLLPRPDVLFLAACHSGSVLDRARASAQWPGGAIVSIERTAAVEVSACVEFEAMFFGALLRGKTAGAASDDAWAFVESNPALGSSSAAPGKLAPSDKFRINESGREVRLAARPAPPGDPPAGQDPPRPPRQSRLSHRSSSRFVGRRREMARIVEALLPLVAGTHRAPGAKDRRLITLTKEGGIGKTAIACEVSDWACERAAFPAGVFELSCEHLVSPQEMVARLLDLLGLPMESQQGDLLGLLRAWLGQRFPPGQAALVVLDNLDDFVRHTATREVRDQTKQILQIALDAAPDLRILATCRWPVGVTHEELVVGIPWLFEEEARDVFLSHLESAIHRAQAEATWPVAQSPVRQLVAMSGRHPQSLELMAAQMRRPGMTLERLCQEARSDLLETLQDPVAADDETDRQLKVERSFERSYRHLSEPAKRLFARLWRLPGGIWCGTLAEEHLPWHDLLGPEWRRLIERELDYYALLHYEPDAPGSDSGVFAMLPPMLQFAHTKYQPADEADWGATWVKFWQERVRMWNALISGRLPDGVEVAAEDRRGVGELRQQMAKVLFGRTQANWRAVYDHLVDANSPLAKDLLLCVDDFCRLSGQLVLLRDLATRGVAALRRSGPEQDLAACLGTLANVQARLGEREAARDSYLEALDIYRRLAKAVPAAFEQGVAMTLNNLGLVQDGLDEWKAARESHLEALETYRRSARAQPALFEQYVAATLNNLGTVQSRLGEREVARDSFVEALDIYRGLARAHPAAFEQYVAMTLNNLGNVQRDLGEPEAARDSFVEALDIYRGLARAHPAAFEQYVAGTLNNLGTVQRALGEREAARESFLEALDIYRRLARAHPAAFGQYVATTLNNLGFVQGALGEREAARESFLEALDIYWPLVQEWPKAFGENFGVVLRNYVGVAPEDAADPWWGIWRALSSGP